MTHRSGNGKKYWIDKIIIDSEEKTAIVEYKSEEDSFRVKFAIWGETSLNLLAKLYFDPIAEIKIDELSHLKIYQKNERDQASSLSLLTTNSLSSEARNGASLGPLSFPMKRL